MKTSKMPLVELTPLLDVVFILIFALMLNVNVSKAEDQETIEVLETKLVNEEQKAKMLEVGLNDLGESLFSYQESLALKDTDIERLNKALDELSFKATYQKKQLTAIESQLIDLMNNAIEASDYELDDSFYAELLKEDVLLKALLKYEQIAKRYLFVEISVSTAEGRITINDTYTGVMFTKDDLTNLEQRKEKQDDLKAFIYNWLDHVEGGYSFVFVTVSMGPDVDRYVEQMVVTVLGEMQPNFSKDQFMVN